EVQQKGIVGRLRQFRSNHPERLVGIVLVPLFGDESLSNSGCRMLWIQLLAFLKIGLCPVKISNLYVQNTASEVKGGRLWLQFETGTHHFYARLEGLVGKCDVREVHIQRYAPGIFHDGSVQQSHRLGSFAKTLVRRCG